MKKFKIVIVMSFLLWTGLCSAEEAGTITGGAKQFDWETCVNAHADDCKKACSKSAERSCPDTCEALARDKCKTEGLSPPVTQPIEPSV